MKYTLKDGLLHEAKIKVSLKPDDIVLLRDCLSSDIVEREGDIIDGITTEQIERDIIERRKTLREKLNKIISKMD
jgi:hypothetical protein